MCVYMYIVYMYTHKYIKAVQIIIFNFSTLELTTKVGLSLQLIPNLTMDVTCIWTLERSSRNTSLQ